MSIYKMIALLMMIEQVACHIIQSEYKETKLQN